MSKENEQERKAGSNRDGKQESLLRWIGRDKDSKRKDRLGDDAAMDKDCDSSSRKESSTIMKRTRPTESIERMNNQICLDGEVVQKPKYPTSYGILLYKKIDETGEFQYLLGLIPQGNAWTVFKGLPETNELPQETAVREFEEETSLAFPYSDWEKCPLKHKLYGVTSTKKLLEIYLIPAPLLSTSLPTGSDFDVSKFNVNKVVRIDSGYMKGKPEIIEIRYMSKRQAIEGVAGRGTSTVAKIYKSQIGILEQAEALLREHEGS
jgi:hypothetical protein